MAEAKIETAVKAKKPAAAKTEKPAAAAKPASKTAASKPATRKLATAKTAAKPKASKSNLSVTPEQRYIMICEAAYYRAERRGFSPENEIQDWLDAEIEINRLLGL